MSIKIFAHRPLGRAELRRLSEPAPSTEPDITPTMARSAPACDTQARWDRAAQRMLDRRQERQATAQLARIAASHEPLIFDVAKLIRWMVEEMAASTAPHRLIEECDMPVLLQARCLICDARPDASHGGSFLLFPLNSKEHRDAVIGAFACRGCDRRKPRYYATLLAGKMAKRDQDAGHDIRTLTRSYMAIKLNSGDKRFLDWMKTHPRDDHQRCLDEMAADGRIDAALALVEAPLEDQATRAT